MVESQDACVCVSVCLSVRGVGSNEWPCLRSDLRGEVSTERRGEELRNQGDEFRAYRVVLNLFQSAGFPFSKSLSLEAHCINSDFNGRGPEDPPDRGP